MKPKEREEQTISAEERQDARDKFVVVVTSWVQTHTILGYCLLKKSRPDKTDSTMYRDIINMSLLLDDKLSKGEERPILFDSRHFIANQFQEVAINNRYLAGEGVGKSSPPIDWKIRNLLYVEINHLVIRREREFSPENIFSGMIENFPEVISRYDSVMRFTTRSLEFMVEGMRVGGTFRISHATPHQKTALDQTLNFLKLIEISMTPGDYLDLE